MKPSFSIPRPTYHPVLFFLIFAVVNALEAYDPEAGFSAKLWIGFLGLVVPFLFALTTAADKPAASAFPSKKESLSPIPVWLILVLFMAGIAARIYGLQSLPVWPLWDDGDLSYYAIQLCERWKWQFFFGPANYGPFFTWGQALFFKWLSPSLFSMWLYPVLYSVLALPVAYWACRKFFNRSFSFLYLLILLFSFWPIYLSKFCLSTTLDLLWEFVALGVLGCLIRAPEKDRSTKILTACLLGFCVGIGYYFCAFWLTCVLFFPLAVFFWTLRNPGLRWKSGLGFTFFTALGFLPLFLMASHENTINHFLKILWITNPGGLTYSQAMVWLSCFTVFFWGSMDIFSFHFDPFWGGFFNPLLSSLFMVGVIELTRYKKQHLGGWILITLAIFLLPGLFANNIEMMRLSPIIPFAFFPMAAGMESVAASFKHKKTIFLFCLVALSFTLDAYHLLGPYHQWSVPFRHNEGSKSVERYRAFQILEKVSREKGPGLVLDELVPDIFDQTLLVATYSFNAARNPHETASESKWAGILAPVSSRPYLTGLFADASNFELAQSLKKGDEGLDLFVVPLTDQNRTLLSRWSKANRVIQDSYSLVPYGLHKSDYGPILSYLSDHFDEFKGDPYLESCFWTQTARYQYQAGNRDDFIQAARKVAGYGHPQGLLYHQWGLVLYEEKNYSEAIHKFILAGKLNPLYAPPQDFLARLETLAKQQPR